MDVYLHTVLAFGSIFVAFCVGYYYGAKAILIAAASGNVKVENAIRDLQD